MSTPIDITGIQYATGRKLAAIVRLPGGLATAAGSTIAGGSVSGAHTIATGDSSFVVGLSESPAGSGVYGAVANTGGTALPDSTTRPYTAEVWVLDDATDMTSYADVAAAAAASTTPAAGRGVPDSFVGGMLSGGVWGGGAVAATPVNQDVSIGQQEVDLR